jgi:threonine/homoserine/homoserine lactone efflux protein
MVDAHTLGLFIATVLALMISPGPNMAFLLSHTASHGVRGGLAVAAGIGAADVMLTVLTATGVSAVAAAWPPFFDGLRYVGAGYLLWLAYRVMRAPKGIAHAEGSPSPLGGIVWRAMLNSLLNPKAVLFFVLFLPQFTDTERGEIGLQLLTLGAVLTGIAMAFHVLLSWVGGTLAQRAWGNTRLARASAWLLASVFVGLALRLLWLEKPQ